MKTLSLLIPGLLGPLPELNNDTDALPQCRVLNTWLSRADVVVTKGATYYKQLAELFDVDANYSIAAVSAQYDQYDCTQAHWYRADPVHFKADVDHVLMFDHQQLQIRHDESQSLVDAFNQHFEEDGLKLVAADDHRWYLQSQNELNITTTTLSDAVGRNVSHFLPEGEGELNWRRLLNEIQMLFHSHAVNEQRESNGELSINGLWLWGEGVDLSASSASDFSWFMGDDAVANGLALVTNCECRALQVLSASELNNDTNGLIVIDSVMGSVSYGDVLAWHDAVTNLCEQWLQPLNKLLMNGKIKQINLYTGEGRLFVITARKCFKFWRRSLSLQHFMNQESISSNE